MTVTDLISKKGHLISVEFSGGESVLIDKDVLIEECIHKDDELTPERVIELKTKSDYVRAKSRALWLLDRYQYTERRLIDKLKSAGFSEDVSQKAVERLKELGVIDDNGLALRFAEECRSRGISKRAAYLKLMQKGFDSDTIKQALENTDFDEQEQLKELIERKYASKIAEGETEKVYAALIRKGFSYNAVRNALKSYGEELDYSGDE
ncbi:MAG: regulatory protein RecX [Clostridia bacterium]|nr:regulatory protein RecX [Clostridia bacterium]